MSSKDKAYKTISALVDRFGEQIDSYKKSDYNETQTRRDFIDPFFKSLGWDMDNENGYAESYREVIHEDKIKIGSATKAPDYSFRLVGGKRLFFVEAKKPSVGVKDNMDPAYQVRRYAWSAKLPISIVTDFEEFAIYDCTKKPLITDKASVSRIQYLNFQDYLKEFDLIWDTFSKEQVLKGSFDKFVKGSANKKGTTTVDKEFLESLDSWRTYLATSISWNNKELDVDEINYAVQLTIDRLIFLRIAEDRSIEPYGNLKLSIKQGDFYQNLFQQFKQADDKYNSGLFDFKKDKLSQALKVDNKVLKTIINELYYPESPYEFSVLSVEILGSAYEQFLGKTITIDKAHRAKIEDKPEVRKAGGVYYTPEYIVEYIVKNTVGKLIENKTPKEIEKIKILDPACGSGSFLIGAFQYLLDWHKNYYTDNGKVSKGGKNNPLTPEGNLTTSEKKRILLNNIFGVDIDLNACEVTKLSLLLKCMEGETEASISSQFRLFNERVLPTLENNIKSGNSLIDVDFYDQQLDLGEEKKVKPFKWKQAFPEIFKDGGFDIVIGNPPYGFMIPKEQQEYFEQKYKHQDYQKDLYLLFLERYESLLKEHGDLGVIISNTWLQSLTLKKIRTYLLHKYRWKKILLLPEKVFDAVVDTVVVIFEKIDPTKKSSFSVEVLTNEVAIHSHSIVQSELPANGDVLNISVTKSKTNLFKKINDKNRKLSELSKVFNGIKPFEKGKGVPPQTKKTLEEKPFVAEGRKPNNKWSPLLRGSLIHRYINLWDENYWVLYGEWLAAPRDPVIFSTNEKIMVRQTSDSIISTIIPSGYIGRNNLHIIIPSSQLDIKYLLGLLNSKLMDFVYSYINPEKGEALAEVKKKHLEMLPIKEIDIKNSVEVKLHSVITKSVEQLLILFKEKHLTKLQSKQSEIERKIDHIEEKINNSVYELYSLTPEEIKIIED